MKDYSRAKTHLVARLLEAILYATAFGLLTCVDAVANELAKVFEGPDPDAIYVRLKAGDYTLAEPDQRYVHHRKGDRMIRMTGYTVDDTPGNPSLPYKLFHVALPPDADPSTLVVEVVHLVEKELPAPITIAPTPPYLLDQVVTPNRMGEWEFHKWGTGKKIVNGRNILVYENDGFFPLVHAAVEVSGQLRKWKAAAIKFYPVRYNPVQMRAVVASELTIKISFDRVGGIPPHREALLRDTTMDKRAKELFLNYDRARHWYQKPLLTPSERDPSSETKKEGRTFVDPNFVIVTTERTRSSSSALADFCFHKQDLGYSVMIVTEDKTYTVTGTPGSYTFSVAGDGYLAVVGEAPNQTPQKIRKWLQDRYLALGIQYVLLVGDPDPDNIGEDNDHIGDIPMLMSWPRLISDTPTDKYYAVLDGNWNHDGDAYFGESYPFGGHTNLPPGVTGDLFSVRWRGVLELIDSNTPSGNVEALFNIYRGGQARFNIDTYNDGTIDDPFGEFDFIFDFDESAGPHPGYLEASVTRPGGTYPVQIELYNLERDAVLKINVSSLTENATAKFKHQNEDGSLADGLLAEYFNSADFSGLPVISQIEPSPDIEYIVSGDRGVGGVDLLEDVTVGRIPFYDEDRDGAPDITILDGILNKIIAYEDADVRGAQWRRRVLCSTPAVFDYDDDPETALTADYQGCETLRSYIAPPPLWEWYRIHDENYHVDAEITDGCSLLKTARAWNDPVDPDDGRGVVMWRTHGAQTLAQNVFEAPQCGELDDDKPSIVIHTTCRNGLPEVGTAGTGDRTSHTYPLAYSLLKQGAIATIAATRNTKGGTFDPDEVDVSRKTNDYLVYFFAKGIFNNVKLGEVVAHVREDNTSDGWLRNVVSYNLYGDPTVSLFGQRPKSNNDTILLLDGSGSMLSEGKWEAAKDAAVLFRDVAAALRHPAFQDRYNTVVFRCIGGSNESSTVPAGTGLKDIARPLTITSLEAFEPEGSYFTPIGGGLEMAYAQFDDPEDEEGFYANRTVVLLSDGKHNCGIDPMGIAAADDVIVHAVAARDDVTVYTVGLGDDSIGTETLSNIAEATGGDYRNSPSPRDLADFFVQILAGTSWKLQNVPVDRGLVTIDQNTAVFLVVWDDPAATIGFELDPPGDAPNVTPAGVPRDYGMMNCTYHAATANETHAFYSCDNIPGDLMGEWRFANINSGLLPVALEDVLLKVVVDPRVLADYSLGEGNVFTGQPITLIARMTEDGAPLAGLTTVYAGLVRSPALAVGTLMAEHGTGKMPPSAADNADRTPRSQYLLQSMKAAKIATLARTGGPRIELRDDGAGVDERAGDGVYTGVFRDTMYEGSYTFEFRSTGTNRDGVAFDRGETLSKFVKFNPSSATTNIAFPSKVINKEEQTGHATVRVTPKDAFGNHLGPFRGGLIQLWSNAGTIATAYEDQYDGSYTFELVYPIDTSPQIWAAVGDVLVADGTPVEVGRTQYWFWLFIVALVLLILAVIVFIVRRFF